jgi:DNA-binding cell septation regulator SpoVG
MSEQLQISEIEIVPVNYRKGLVAFASIILSNQLYLGNIAIYTTASNPTGFRLVYPTRNLENGTKLPIAYPITKETGLRIQEHVVREYQKLMEKLTKEVQDGRFTENA